MLTVKQREKNGYEGVVEAVSVAYEPRNSDNPRAQLLAFGVPGDYPKVYANGEIFVMNDKGKTIARYDLDEDNREVIAADREALRQAESLRAA